MSYVLHPTLCRRRPKQSCSARRRASSCNFRLAKPRANPHPRPHPHPHPRPHPTPTPTPTLQACEAELYSVRSQLSDAASERDRLRDALSHSSSEEASRQLAHEAQLQADKEARIELLRKRTARRLLNQELVRGWGAWYELWSVRAERRRLMGRAVSTLAPLPRSSLAHLPRSFPSRRSLAPLPRPAPSPFSLAPPPTLTLTPTLYQLSRLQKSAKLDRNPTLTPDPTRNAVLEAMISLL